MGNVWKPVEDKVEDNLDPAWCVCWGDTLVVLACACILDCAHPHEFLVRIANIQNNAYGNGLWK